MGLPLGVNDYMPFAGEQDTGSDGDGINNRGEKVFVQIKSGLWDEKVSSERRGLETFHHYCLLNGVGLTSTDQMFLFTSANGVGWETTDRYFHNRLKFIARNFSGGILSKPTIEKIFSLETLIGKNNHIFWESFLDKVQKS